MSTSPQPRQAARDVVHQLVIPPAMKIEVQHHNKQIKQVSNNVKRVQRPEAKKRVQSGSFKSPKAMGVNTISLNFGKRGDAHGQFVSESPPAATRREVKAGLHQKGLSKKHRAHKPKNKHEKDKEKLETLDSDEEESEGSDFLRQDHFRRGCCHQAKITDHQRPDWQPKFKWARNDYQVFSLQTKKQKKESQEKGLGERIKVLRRKQFFNFLADFFDKLEDG